MNDTLTVCNNIRYSNDFITVPSHTHSGWYQYKVLGGPGKLLIVNKVLKHIHSLLCVSHTFFHTYCNTIFGGLTRKNLENSQHLSPPRLSTWPPALFFGLYWRSGRSMRDRPIPICRRFHLFLWDRISRRCWYGKCKPEQRLREHEDISWQVEGNIWIIKLKALSLERDSRQEQTSSLKTPNWMRHNTQVWCFWKGICVQCSNLQCPGICFIKLDECFNNNS